MNSIQKKLLKRYYMLHGYYPAKLGEFEFRVAPEDWFSWRRIKKGRWEPYTIEIFSRYLKEDDICLDIGAWIGPTVLFASQLCRQVYCFEPDPHAFRKLLANIQLNAIPNVTAINKALYRDESVIGIGTEQDAGGSMTSILDANSETHFRVETTTLAKFVEMWGVEKIDFIKIDIEGAEYELIPSILKELKEFRPTIYLSLHGPKLGDSERREKTEILLSSLLSIYPRLLNRKLEDVRPDYFLDEHRLNSFEELLLSKS